MNLEVKEFNINDTLYQAYPINIIVSQEEFEAKHQGEHYLADITMLNPEKTSTMATSGLPDGYYEEKDFTGTIKVDAGANSFDYSVTGVNQGKIIRIGNTCYFDLRITEISTPTNSLTDGTHQIKITGLNIPNVDEGIVDINVFSTGSGGSTVTDIMKAFIGVNGDIYIVNNYRQRQNIGKQVFGQYSQIRVVGVYRTNVYNL